MREGEVVKTTDKEEEEYDDDEPIDDSYEQNYKSGSYSVQVNKK